MQTFLSPVCVQCKSYCAHSNQDVPLKGNFSSQLITIVQTDSGRKRKGLTNAYAIAFMHHTYQILHNSNCVKLGNLRSILTLFMHVAIYFNHLGDEGAKGISVGLTKSTCLEDLRLSYNGISDAGIYALAKASVSNKSLKELNLTWNMDISDKSGKKYGFRKEIKVYWPEK
eukprot:TRINITY_DN715_c0_g1_i2.p2 TRINITY_DN715_c0_g1~~TRINITY_DN715_c0_g1_i2.p2  ORF type:complete len:171 (-),score=5.62 TRINITY_DN715_c0_g1_i2:82-594(-)